MIELSTVFQMEVNSERMALAIRFGGPILTYLAAEFISPQDATRETNAQHSCPLPRNCRAPIVNGRNFCRPPDASNAGLETALRFASRCLKANVTGSLQSVVGLMLRADVFQTAFARQLQWSSPAPLPRHRIGRLPNPKRLNCSPWPNQDFMNYQIIKTILGA